MGHEFSSKAQRGKAVIIIDRDLDSDEAVDALGLAIEKTVERGEKSIVLDLSLVQAINSSAIGRILKWYKRLDSEQILLMVKPLKGTVKETFEVLSLDTLLPVDET